MFTSETLDGRSRAECPICKRPIETGPIVATVVDPNCEDPAVICAELAATRADLPVEFQNIVGVWRSGNRLVVNLAEHRFPLWCVKTNRPVECTSELRLKWLADRWAWSLFGGSLGRSIGSAVGGQLITLDIGLSRKWIASHFVQRIVTTCFFYAALLGFLIIGTAFGSANLGGAACALIPFIASLVALVLVYRQALRITEMRDLFVWMSGVHPEYLAKLPEWPDQ